MFNKKNKLPETSVSIAGKRKKLFKFILLGTVSTLVVVVIYIHGQQPPIAKPAPVPVKSRSNITPEQTWMGTAQQQVNTLKDSNFQLHKQIESMQSQNKSLANGIKTLTNDFEKYQEQQKEQANLHKNEKVTITKHHISGTNLTNIPGSNNQTNKSIKDMNNRSINNNMSESIYNTQMLVYTAPKIERKKIKVALKDNPNAGTISIGSWMKASLISGGEFPAGESSQSMPRTVFLRILSDATMANGYKYNLKGCIAEAAGWGSETTKRVYMKVQQISCTGFKGDKAVLGNLVGQVFDADAHVGVRGKYVANEGYRAFMATMGGIFSGVASVASQSQGTTYSGATGTTNVLTPSASMRSGGLDGAAGGLGELSKYYIKRMEEIQPYIDVNAGRIVTLIVTQNTPLHWVDRQSIKIPATSDTTVATVKKVEVEGKQSFGNSISQMKSQIQKLPKMMPNYNQFTKKVENDTQNNITKVNKSGENIAAELNQINNSTSSYPNGVK